MRRSQPGGCRFRGAGIGEIANAGIRPAAIAFAMVTPSACIAIAFAMAPDGRRNAFCHPQQLLRHAGLQAPTAVVSDGHQTRRFGFAGVRRRLTGGSAPPCRHRAAVADGRAAGGDQRQSGHGQIVERGGENPRHFGQPVCRSAGKDCDGVRQG